MGSSRTLRSRWSAAVAGGFCLLLLLSAVATYAQAQVSELAVKAELIERFILFTRFPDSALTGRDRFSVCVDGDTALARLVIQRIDGSKLHELTTAASPIEVGEAIEECQVLVLTTADDDALAAFLEGVDGLPILTISGHDDLSGRGTMLSVLIENRRAVFEVDSAAVEAAGLELSSMLLRYARPVGERQ